MRNGFLATMALLIGSAVAHAQQWPTYGYPQGPAYGYPQYSGYGYPQYPGYAPGYNMPRPGAYYPGYQQWTPQQVQVNSALVYPRAGYATPVNQQGNPSQSTTYVPAPRVVSLPQTVSQAIPEPLPAGPDHPTSTPFIHEPTHVLPPSTCCGAGCGGCEHNDLLCPPKEQCKPACKHECFWITGNFLMAWAKADPGVPLVTTGFIGVGGLGGDPIPGALRQPTTSVLYGQNVNYNLIPGFQMGAGIWLDRDNTFSVDMSGFYLPLVHQSFATQSDVTGSPLITRPVINPLSGLEEAYIVAFPGRVSGDISISNTLTMWGAEVDGRYHARIGRAFSLEGLAGVRYLNLVEVMRIDEDLVPLVGAGGSGLTFLANPVDPPNTITTRDAFRTTNQFIGFQLGGAARWESERFFFDLHAKAAVGVNQQSVQISGVSILNDANGNPMLTAPGGILALPSNIGNHNRSVVSVVPEGGFTAGVNVTSWLRCTAGYSFLYMNNVVRPTSHIDRVVNPGQVPTDQDFGATGGPPRPTFQYHEDGFWVHMFNVGVEFHY